MITKLLTHLLELIWRKLPGLTLIVLLGLTAPCSGDFEPSQYKWYKNIEVQTPMNEVIASAQFDSQIYFSARKYFPGLRIIDNNNAEVPYHIEQSINTQPRVIEQLCRSEVNSLRELPDNKIEIIVQLQYGDLFADGLTLITPQKNYERRVSVFGSEDGINWIEIVSGALVFDYSRYMDVHNRRIDLPKNKFRIFRLEVEDVIDERASPFRNLWLKLNDKTELEHIEQFSIYNRTFRIDRIDLWRNITSQQFEKEVKANYPVVDFTVKEDEDKKQTVIEVVTHREPLTSLGFVTPDRNYHRQAHIEVKRIQYGNEIWIEIGRQSLLKIQLQGFQQKNRFIEFPEHRDKIYRLIIDNHDNPPLKISGVEAIGNVYEILYLNKAENNYRMFYGSETAEKPKYDFANVLNSMRESVQTLSASLSEEIINPEFNKESDRKSFQFLENKWFLTMITALMVVVLGWVVYSTARKI